MGVHKPNNFSKKDTLRLVQLAGLALLLSSCVRSMSTPSAPTPTGERTGIPTGTPSSTPSLESSPTPSSTPSLELSPTPTLESNRITEWSNYWPDTAEEAAAMFGGQASDWMRSPDWSGEKKAQSSFYQRDYFPIEWRPTNPETPPYYWPKTQEEAVSYFFPGQDLDPSWMRQNQYGGWELMQDHWIDGYNTDMIVTIHPGVVAEGYTVDGDDVATNDRNFVAWGGISDAIHRGIALPLVSGQGMTLWPPGTDPNKIGIEGKPYNIPYYTGPGGEQLGPDAVNFTPIYNAPGYPIIGRVNNVNSVAFMPQTSFVESPREKTKKVLPLAGGTNPQTVRRAQDRGPGAIAFQKNPFKGIRNM